MQDHTPWTMQYPVHLVPPIFHSQLDHWPPSMMTPQTSSLYPQIAPWPRTGKNNILQWHSHMTITTNTLQQLVMSFTAGLLTVALHTKRWVPRDFPTQQVLPFPVHVFPSLPLSISCCNRTTRQAVCSMTLFTCDPLFCPPTKDLVQNPAQTQIHPTLSLTATPQGTQNVPSPLPCLPNSTMNSSPKLKADTLHVCPLLTLALSTIAHNRCKAVFLYSLSSLLCFYTFSAPSLLEMKFYRNFFLSSFFWGRVSKPTNK